MNEEFDKFTLKCHQTLYLVLADYNILKKHKADIIAVALLCNKAKGKEYIKQENIISYFVEQKSKFIKEKCPGETET
jgi:hypothetical protein